MGWVGWGGGAHGLSPASKVYDEATASILPSWLKDSELPLRSAVARCEACGITGVVSLIFHRGTRRLRNTVVELVLA